jgi:hypothetical protein
METFEPTKHFDFTDVYLDTPQPVQGGSFFTKLFIQDGKPLYIQLPKCISKQGVVTTKKSKYCDLLYEKENQESLIGWILALEEHCQQNIYDKSDVWFHNDFTKDDIETLMSPVYRLYNSGKKLLVRTYIDVGRENKQHKCIVYDERELQVDVSRVTPHTSIIPLVLIEGVKFSSKSFDIVIKLSQIMILDDQVEPVQNCLIRRANQQTHISLEDDDKDNDNISESDGSTKTNIVCTPLVKSMNEVIDEPSHVSDVISDEAKEANDLLSKTEIEHEGEVDVSEESPISESNVIEDDTAFQNKECEGREVEQEVVPKDYEEDNIEQCEDRENGESLEEEKTLENVELAQIDALIIPDGAPMNLRKPNEIYYEIYKAAKEKAKKMRMAAVEAYLETKEIKSKYMLQDIDDSDDDSLGSEIEES